MGAMDEHYRKTELTSKYHPANNPKIPPNVVYAEPCRPCNPYLTYFNNGKENRCCKTGYDYNFFFCEGYDQYRHREDQKHQWFYMNTDLEEQFPCRTVPILTSSNYGHRPPYDNTERHPRVQVTRSFMRSCGLAMNTHSNGYTYPTVSYSPMKPFMWNAQYGYTYAPPKNN